VEGGAASNGAGGPVTQAREAAPLPGRAGEAPSDAERASPARARPGGEPLHRALGLTDEEAAEVVAVLGRAPNELELSMYAVMWSEHCSYKSSRLHLRRLPSEGPQVLVGPGENAGVVDAGDGFAVALRVESHNHPSAVEPYQGAATGVGGILRDVFAMGARPVALLDALCFGPLDDPRSRYLFEGVVSGISGYGNAVGVPTVGGQVVLDACYRANPLVNVACVGLLRADQLVLARATGPGNLVVLLGASTGRDGIGGVSVLASAGLGAEAGPGDDAKRPSVQVGDPYEEKRLIEACLELVGKRLVVAVQDLGGAGLTCAASETATRGGVGMDLDVTAVPRREPGMTPVEVMTSESQERMLVVVEPSALGDVLEVCRRHEVSAAVVGRVTEGDPAGAPGRLRVLDGAGGEVLADVPAASLTEGAPLYDRPRRPPADLEARRRDDPARLPEPEDCGAELLGMVADPAFVYRQYDHQLFLNTVEGPGGDAAVLRLGAPGVGRAAKGLALSADGNGRWCALDPRRGAAMVVAEAALNVALAGARPLALVDCLNLGNPEHEEVMWQLSEVVDGIAWAAEGLELPVVGGNVSLYNEAGGYDIDPTPVVVVVGLLDVLERRPPGVRLAEGDELVLLGPFSDGLGGSRFAAERRGHRGGELPALDLATHRRLLGLVRHLAREGLAEGLHDVSDGGLAVTLAELAFRSGVGLSAAGVASHRELFSEGPSRVVVATRAPATVAALAARARVPCRRLGVAGGSRLVVEDLGGRRLVDLALDELARAFAHAIPDALGAPVPPGQVPGRRASSADSASSGTERSPRPTPTMRSGL
jgi:phosphoribosylformylglycinamidine synthase II